MEQDKKQKIWDMTFKTLLLETPKLFFPLIKEVFGTEYSRENEVILLNNEFYNKDGSKIISDTSFQIKDKKYHFECQYTNEKEMVLRMFEYDFHIGISEMKMKEEYLTFHFPKSCVVYISANKKNPSYLQMKVIFPDDTSVLYKVPTIRIQEYSLDEIEQKNLALFTPFLILRYINKLKNIKQTKKNEIFELYQNIILLLNQLYQKNEINALEIGVLLESLKKTEEHVLKNFPLLKEEVNHMLTETFELESVKIAKTAEKKTTFELLIDLYQDGVDFSYIQKQARKRGISDEELKKVLGIKEIK